eukprot:2381895-Prymnesium_polylepis.1
MRRSQRAGSGTCWWGHASRSIFGRRPPWHQRLAAQQQGAHAASPARDSQEPSRKTGGFGCADADSCRVTATVCAAAERRRGVLIGACHDRPTPRECVRQARVGVLCGGLVICCQPRGRGAESASAVWVGVGRASRSVASGHSRRDDVNGSSVIVIGRMFVFTYAAV